MAQVDEREEQELLDPVERKVPFYLRVELYIPLILIAGISLAVLLYAQGMIGAGWQLNPKTTTVTGAFGDSTQPVVLYASPTTRSYLATVSGNQDVLLKPWREYFKAHKLSFKEVNEPTALADHKGSVVIVPSAVALNDVERKALTEHHDNGGSILATGPFGARDGSGNWVGWTLMQKLFGTRVLDELDPAAEKNFLVMAGNIPITARFENGSRFWVGKSPEKALRFEGGKPAARFLDWARTPDGKGPSVVFGERDKGRYVLFGFSENSWDAAPTAMRALSDGAIDWLQRTPRAVVSAWPAGFQAAHMITMNVDEPVENMANLASSLDSLKMRGTFFVVADAAAKSPNTLKTLAGGHEIAYHGDGYKGFKDQGKAEQARRVKEMQTRLAIALRPEDRVGGFRAPAESYDAKTEEVLQAAGFRYHAVDPNRSDARLPKFAKANGRPPVDDIVVLPRTQRDDIVYLQATEPVLNDIIATMKGELGIVLEEGALGMLSVHSRNFAQDSVMSQAVPAYLLTLAELRQQIWFPTGTEVSDWWRKRDNFRVALSSSGKRYELEVSNVGETNIEGATVMIYHPYPTTVTLTPTKAWMPEATIRKLDDMRSQVIFASVGKGHFGYTLGFQ
jgi:peptidoglycan/xylan/chitin deacetylase (PgdA/CDA1 family)